jgi:hypothetical protein
MCVVLNQSLARQHVKHPMLIVNCRNQMPVNSSEEAANNRIDSEMTSIQAKTSLARQHGSPPGEHRPGIIGLWGVWRHSCSGLPPAPP